MTKATDGKRAAQIADKILMRQPLAPDADQSNSQSVPRDERPNLKLPCILEKLLDRIAPVIHLTPGMVRNIALYPWFRLLQNLLFWQAIWFLYFQNELSAAEAILLYSVLEITTTVLEVPSGYLSDRIGRRTTLMIASIFAVLGGVCLAAGQGFVLFALGMGCLGASGAFVSGTDTSLLYQSLAALDRRGDADALELRGWRFAFGGLAISAITGGVAFTIAPALPFWAAAAAGAGMFAVSLAMTEPAGSEPQTHQKRANGFLTSLQKALVQPVLLWLFGVAVTTYAFGHVLFVFGQPFIDQALAGIGQQANTPIVAGLIAALMMGISLVTSLAGPALRDRLGTAGVLLLALTLQITLIATVSLSTAWPLIAILMLRMVPNSISQAYLRAASHPFLEDATRATYLSLQSLGSKLALSVSLWLAAIGVSDQSAMSATDLNAVFATYALSGAICVLGLMITARVWRIPHLISTAFERKN